MGFFRHLTILLYPAAAFVFCGCGFEEPSATAIDFQSDCLIEDLQCKPKDPKEDTPILNQAPGLERTHDAKRCDDRIGAGCFDLAKKWDKGRGGSRDMARARELYQQACTLRHAPGCNNLGLMWALGHGGPADMVRAKGFFDKACNGNDAMGCSNLGAMWAWAEGGSSDLGLARAKYQKACTLGYDVACARLGWMLSFGWGGLRNRAKAKELCDYARSRCQ